MKPVVLVLAKGRRVLGPEHPEVIRFMNNLGYAQYKRGEHDEAERFLVDSLRLARRVLGDEQVEFPDVFSVAILLLHEAASTE